MREYGLLHETDPSLPFLRLKDSLYIKCESPLPLVSKFIDDAILTDLNEVFNPPLTSSHFVTPSFFSSPIAATISELTILTSPLPLVKCTRLEIGQSSKGYASVIEDDSLV